MEAPGAGTDRDAEIFRRMSVTQFIDYLSCPFRFYLKHVLRMEPFDATRDEMDARGFGSLIHDSIERLHACGGLRYPADEAAIAVSGRGGLCPDNRNLRGGSGSAGDHPTGKCPQPAARVCRIQAAEREAGWRIEHVEKSFPETLEDVEMSGRIDRLIEYHAGTGQRRVIDYKTAAKGTNPEKAHIKALRGGAGARLPAWQQFDLNDKRLMHGPISSFHLP